MRCRVRWKNGDCDERMSHDFAMMMLLLMMMMTTTMMMMRRVSMLLIVLRLSQKSRRGLWPARSLRS
jgi:hypothetical protein